MFKPMLAGTPNDIESDLSKISYPVLVSPKLDGIRATMQEGKLRSRSLKDIPNSNVQRMFQGLPEGIDGELIFGSPTAPDVFRKTTSIVMSDDKDATGITFNVFDIHNSQGFEDRLILLGQVITGRPWRFLPLTLVEHVFAHDLERVLHYETLWTERGYEGLMLRSLKGPYKEGRSTLREGYLLKIKRFSDADAEVIGSFELEHNDNVAFQNELGRTARSSSMEGKRKSGILGGLVVRDLKTDVEFNIGTGFDAQQRFELWSMRDALPGRIVKYKYLPTGQKEKPRHPVWLGWRSKEDI